MTLRTLLQRLLRHLKGDPRGAADVRWIDVGELAPRLAGGEAIAVIDVRAPDELAGPLSHIPDARNVPLDELPGRVRELRSLSETPVVLVCMTDRRSARAAAMLDAAGLRDVRVLRGGMVRWNESGLPVGVRPSGSDTSPPRSE